MSKQLASQLCTYHDPMHDNCLSLQYISQGRSIKQTEMHSVELANHVDAVSCIQLQLAK